MFATLKIRTSLLFVLGIFSLALWTAVFIAWTDARLSARAMNELIELSDRQIQPLHEVERLFQSTLINMDNAYINLVRGDQVKANDYTRKASTALQEAKKTFDAYRKGDKSEAGLAERSRQVGGAYDAYTKVLEAREVALYDVSLDAYAAATTSAEDADRMFAATLRKVITHAESVRDRLSADSERRYAIAAYLAGGLFVFSLLLVGLYWMLFARVLLRPLATTGRHFDRIAGGDLSAPVEGASSNEIGVLLGALQRMQQGLVETVSSIRSGTEDVNRSAGDIAHGNIDLAARTEQQASSLEETAATLEQLSAAVKQNAENTLHTNRLAATAAGDAVKGGELMMRIVGTMDQVSSSASKISEIVSVIDGIAFQTNILALNAAVEAARAGTQGRGFAVVATEVRSLALRSAEAAKEVKVLIGESAACIDLASAQVMETGRAMEQIVTSVNTVMNTMNDISVATQEQAEGLEQVSRVVVEMDKSTQENAALVDHTAAAANALTRQAGSLLESVSVFSIDTAEPLPPETPLLAPGLSQPDREPAAASMRALGYDRARA
ncbi:methyl-accepting chemotaxis protein [Herbaspirillum hiltneri]|uniref:methyl-accepting chemotaxis protein n=1 Tax=Herbaspirillum hiltneri TaxID=341045 RepID=UPI0009F83DEB|nr:methyl-accepting chemotaxis protein [Herbaspirillum hiltneri]